MNKPLVSVIFICYDQKPYVRSTIQSVLDQRYANVEFIIVEVATTDGSKELIDQLIAAHPGIKFFPQKKMVSYNKAFNLALKHAKGEYIINLNAGDMLKVNRIEEGVSGFQDYGSSYDINYTDAELIDEHGTSSGNFYSHTPSNKPEGNIFNNLIMGDLIYPPTLMYRKKVMDELKGYDKYRTNKDIGFLLHASKTFKFFYIDQALVKVRAKAGFSGMQTLEAPQQHHIYQFLLQAESLLETKKERKTWKKRVKTEFLKALKSMKWKLALNYFHLYMNRQRLDK